MFDIIEENKGKPKSYEVTEGINCGVLKDSPLIQAIIKKDWEEVKS